MDTSASPKQEELGYLLSGTLPIWLGTIAILWSATCAAHAAPSLSFDVSDATPSVLETITVDMVGTDLTDFYGYNLDVEFSSPILGIVTVEPGPFLGSGGGTTLSGLEFFAFDTSVPGEIQNINDSLLGSVSGVSGSGVLATITFDVLSAGEASLAFLAINTAAGTELIDSTGQPIVIASASGAVVSAVPLPASVLLLVQALGLLALVQFRRLARPRT